MASMENILDHSEFGDIFNSSNFSLYFPHVNGSALGPIVPCNATGIGFHFPDAYRLYSIIVNIYIVGFLCLVGFIGNALSIVVLNRDHDKKNTTNWLLQTLALVDTFYLLACVFIQILKTINEETDWIPGLQSVFPYIEPYSWAFASIAQTVTVWTVVLVTVDRYIAVCKPLKAQLRSLQRAKIAVVCVTIAAILYNLPRFFERKFIFETDCWGNHLVKTKKTSLRESREYFLVYKTICYFVFRTIGPLLMLIILNLRLIKALHAVRRKQKDMNKTSKHRENITLMLVVVVSIFIICELPDLILRIVATLGEFLSNMAIDYIILKYINVFTNLMLAVNSSINFLIYCLIGKKFRKILAEMYACRHGRSGRSEMSETEPLTLTTRTAATRNGTAMQEIEKEPDPAAPDADVPL